MVSKPRIGITSDPRRLDWDDAKGIHYIKSVSAFGGEPVILRRNGKTPGQLVSSLDGIIFSGGGDIHPQFYGEEPNGVNMSTVSIERDEWELELFEISLELEMPILGICRGFQLVNIALGGGLVQHIRGHKPSRRTPSATLYHPICGEAGNLDDRCQLVNSFHHQGVTEDRLASGLTPSALSPGDELVEAFRHQDGMPLRGVQWHPERMPDYLPAKQRVFRWLISEAAKRTLR